MVVDEDDVAAAGADDAVVVVLRGIVVDLDLFDSADQAVLAPRYCGDGDARDGYALRPFHEDHY